MNWKRHLPNTIFICPNGHERCHLNPSGYQWFDLSNEDPKYILAQSQKAEKKLIQFIDEVKKEYDIDNDKEITFKIVGNLESNPDKGDISIDTPIARGLVGKFVEDEIVIETPSGKLNYEILDVKHI